MKLFFGLIFALFSLPAYASSLGYIDISGTINPGSANFIQTSISQAVKNNDIALIIRLNTPGGLLSSTRDIIQFISESPIPVVLYVAPGGASATSAGAIIGISSHVLAMAPGTNIGAAHPVDSGGKDIEGDMANKVTNDTGALVRAQAQLRKRNVNLIEQLVTKSVSLPAEEAVAKKVVDFIATDFDHLLKQLDGRTVFVEKTNSSAKLSVPPSITIHTIEMSLGQKFLHLIANPNISTMLLALAGIALYSEVSSGFTLIIPGVLGLFCGLLAFVSLQMLPINVGGVLLFALGIVLLIAEAFIVSFGALTAAGIGAIFLGALFLIDPAGGSIQVSMDVLVPILVGIGVVVGLIAYIFAKDRKKVAKTLDPVVGKSGVVVSIQGDGKSGTAQVQGELWHFVSETALNKGDEVTARSVRNLVIHVVKKN